MAEIETKEDTLKKRKPQARTVVGKKQMIEALEQSLGIVTSACRLTGISRSKYYCWLESDPEFKKAVEDVQEICLDFAESKLHDQISDGNVSATIFYLKTKGKKRGYIERQEVQEIGKLPDFSGWSDEQIRKYLDENNE